MSAPDDQALEWLVRLNDDRADDKLRAEFARWHQRPENAAAWAEAQAFWNRLAPVTAEMRRQRQVSRRAAMAVGGAALLTPLGFWLTRPGRFADYRTTAGETRRLQLDDGSRVDLAAGSALSVDFGRARRDLTLHRGEAFFQVAPDAARPFIVSAGGAEFTALGTAFNLRLVTDRISLTVTEHRVLARRDRDETTVDEGQMLDLGQDGRGPRPRPQAVDPELATAWRHDRLIFAAAPLGEVMDVLGRNAGWTVMLSRAAARIPVTAMFSLSRLEEAPETIARTLPVQLSRLPGGVIVIRAR
ncbi:FecR protein [Rhodovulum sulfidophilum]|uniref:FecR protein n=1 Tax=Rhodovulum sulfidophilum TaxID=35806 RepID=A0A0D6B381_RHOSU|nr:FecR protein [Rhodovulum sulfidophilum]